MKMWYRHEGRSKASKLALEILEYVDEHLRGFEWRPLTGPHRVVRWDC